MNLKEFALPIGQHSVLNPKLWEPNNKLKNTVRGALLRIAEDFIEFVDVPVKVVDIIIAGGNANFTYTNKSDIDLHIITDFDSVYCDREVEELFDTKRLLYRYRYDLTIDNIPVELYVEDKDHPAVTASYSLIKNKWIKPPQRIKHKIDQKKLTNMVSIWHTVLKHAIKTGDLQIMRNSVKLLRRYRKLGLYRTKEGEFSMPNLVYKSLRNDDTLKGITHLIDRLHGKKLSI
jgi:predicted nucleotidyltransferase